MYKVSITYLYMQCFHFVDLIKSKLKENQKLGISKH